MSARCITRYVKSNGVGLHRTDADWEEYKLGIVKICDSAPCHSHGETIRAESTGRIIGWRGQNGTKHATLRFETEYSSDLAAEEDGVVIMRIEFEAM